eukprot:798304-Rhodomonas_salina.2
MVARSPEKVKTPSTSRQEFTTPDPKTSTKRVGERHSDCKEPVSLDKLLSNAKAGAKRAREEDDDEEEEGATASSSKKPLHVGKVTREMAEKIHANMQTADAQTLINGKSPAIAKWPSSLRWTKWKTARPTPSIQAPQPRLCEQRATSAPMSCPLS